MVFQILPLITTIFYMIFCNVFKIVPANTRITLIYMSILGQCVYTLLILQKMDEKNDLKFHVEKFEWRLSVTV